MQTGCHRAEPQCYQCFSGSVTKPHKNMFKKLDEEFDEVAADPIRRRAKITNLSLCRTFLGFGCVGITFGTVADALSGGKAAIGGVLVATSFAALVKCESDLRLLRAIERLQRSNDEKPTA
jgi:hypothetical protein